MSTKTWDVWHSYHNSWYRSRKIKEDSSTEREKISPSIWAYIYHSPMYESIAGFFSNEKWSRNLQIGNAFNDWKSTISHANWQCLTKKSYKFVLFFIWEVPLKEIKKICCQFEWWNRDLILLKINNLCQWVNSNIPILTPQKGRKRVIFTTCPYFCKNLSVVMYRKFRNIPI